LGEVSEGVEVAVDVEVRPVEVVGVEEGGNDRDASTSSA
jgi:hypothetical protein